MSKPGPRERAIIKAADAIHNGIAAKIKHNRRVLNKMDKYRIRTMYQACVHRSENPGSSDKNNRPWSYSEVTAASHRGSMISKRKGPIVLNAYGKAK